MVDVLKEICEGKPGDLIKNDLLSKLHATSDFSIGSSWSKGAVETGSCCSYLVRSLAVKLSNCFSFTRMLCCFAALLMRTTQLCSACTSQATKAMFGQGVSDVFSDNEKGATGA